MWAITERGLLGHGDIGRAGGQQAHAATGLRGSVGRRVRGQHLGGRHRRRRSDPRRARRGAGGRREPRLARRARLRRSSPPLGRSEPAAAVPPAPASSRLTRARPLSARKRRTITSRSASRLRGRVDHLGHSLAEVAVHVQPGELAQLGHLQQPQLLEGVVQAQVAGQQRLEQPAQVVTVIGRLAHSLKTFRALSPQIAARAAGDSASKPSR